MFEWVGLSQWVHKVRLWHSIEWQQSRFQIWLEIVFHCGLLYDVCLRIGSFSYSRVEARLEDQYGRWNHLLHHGSSDFIGRSSSNLGRVDTRSSHRGINGNVPFALLCIRVYCFAENGVFLFFQCDKCVLVVCASERNEVEDLQSQTQLKTSD